MKIFWFSLGVVCVGLGVAGLILPGLPGTVFLLVAAWCFARSSDRAHRWLVEHDWLGPPIVDWQAHGVVRRRAKWTASVVMAAALIVTLSLGVAWWAVGMQATALACVALFLWTRPEAPAAASAPSLETEGAPSAPAGRPSQAETVPAPTLAEDPPADRPGVSPGSRT